MPKPSESAATLLDSPVRRSIIDTLTEHGAASAPARHSAAELALQLGLHVTTVRFHLDQLAAAGLVQSEFVRTGSAGRPRKLYSAAEGLFAMSQADADIDAMRILTSLLTENFGATDGRQPMTPEGAGRQWAATHVAPTHESPAETWGQWLGKVGQVIDVLQRWGYSPQLTTTSGRAGTRIDLTHCPFRELAQTNTAVVCGIHRGLIAGTMTQVGEPDSEVELLPFAEGATCIAHVRPAQLSPAVPRRMPHPTKESSP
jgi:predicted ArsR family transcriptional regulator